MGLRSRYLFASLLALAACGVEPPSAPEQSTTADPLTADEIDSSWFSDAQFTNPVGESDLLCSGGKYQWGQINTKYVARFTWPCNGAGGGTPTCYEYDGLSGWKVVTCPAWVF